MCKNKLFLILVHVILLIGCSIGGDEVPGLYVTKNQINTIDSLRILSNGVYTQDLYRKADNSLIYHNTGTWKYKNERIIFNDFFLNEDAIYGKNAGDFERILITSSLTLEKTLGKIFINYREDKGNYGYEKQ